MILGQFRRDTRAEWESKNPILRDGEFVLVKETPTSKYTAYKTGDGVSRFKDLPYFSTVSLMQELGQSTTAGVSQKLFSDKIVKLEQEQFVDSQTIDAKKANALNALKSWKVYTENSKYQYVLVAAKNNRAVNDMLIIYYYTLSGEKAGELYYGSNNIEFIEANVWRSQRPTAQGEVVEIVFDHSLITDSTQFVDTVSKDLTLSLKNHLYKPYVEKPFNYADFYRVTEDNCLSITNSAYTLPVGLSIKINGKGTHTLDSEVVANRTAGYLDTLVFDWDTKTFKTVNTSAAIPRDGYIVCTGIGSEYYTKSQIYKVNGVVYRNSIPNSNLFFNQSKQVKNSYFFDNVSEIKDAKYLNFLDGIKTLSVHSSEHKYDYVIIASKDNRSAIDMLIIFSYDKDGVRGEDVRLGVNNITWVTNTIWHAKRQVNKTDYIDITFDQSVITASTAFQDTTTKTFTISRRCYSSNVYDSPSSGKAWCSLGASTSTQPWLQRAVTRMQMTFQKFGVPGCSWSALSADTVLDLTGAAGENNCMMNQVARLFQHADQNPNYYPDVISFLCGINDASRMAAEDWNKGITADLTGLTPTNWFTNASVEYRMSAPISMRAVIEFIAKRFPLAQMIVMTPQMTTALSITVGNGMADNIKNISKRLSIPVVDFYYESGFNDITGTDKVFSNDNLHPNTAGEAMFENFAFSGFSRFIALRK